jgi:uncharacterized membrane protein YecN with MAPEG domain
MQVAHVAAVCTALLGLLVFGLGLMVSLNRGRSNTNFGYPMDPTDPLYKAVRAHGNAAEYAPMMALLILYLGTRAPGGWLTAIFVLAVVSRYLHALGMIRCESLDRPDPLRFTGAVGTYLTGLILAVAALLR